MNRKSNTNYIDKILRTENAYLKKLHELVAESVKEQELIAQNLMSIPKQKPPVGQRIADHVASFGGSWTFIVSFLLILLIWIIINLLMSTKAFDPFPFILLNLVLSCIAAIQAPIIMMSQNRQEEKDRQRAENDYLINLKSEIEIRNLHQKLNLLMEEQMKGLIDIQKYQTAMLEEIKKGFDQNPKS